MPSYNVTPLDTVSLVDTSKWYSWNVLDAILQAVNNGSDVVTIVLQGDEEQKDISPIQFVSRDTAISKSLKPLLTIYYTIIPEFPSFLILPLFMIATLLAVIVSTREKIKLTTKREKFSFIVSFYELPRMFVNSK